jgi:hypothetical protein
MQTANARLFPVTGTQPMPNKLLSALPIKSGGETQYAFPPKELMIEVVVNRVTIISSEMSHSHQLWTERHARLI